MVKLEVTVAFNGLNKEEQLYAHYLSKASWFGSLIVFFQVLLCSQIVIKFIDILPQTSVESPLIFTFFHRILKKQSLAELRQLAKELDENEWKVMAISVWL